MVFCVISCLCDEIHGLKQLEGEEVDIYSQLKDTALLYGGKASELEVASHVPSTVKRVMDACMLVLSQLSPSLHSLRSCPGEWCHPQWASLLTSISIIQMFPSRHAQRSVSQLLSLMTDTNHLELILVRASLAEANRTDLPCKEPAFTQSPPFPLASSVSVLKKPVALHLGELLPYSGSCGLWLVCKWLPPCGGCAGEMT